MRGSGGAGRAQAALLLVLALLLAGCAGAPGRHPELELELQQSRDNENRHLVQVVLSNPAGPPVEVVRLQLRAARFVDVAPTVRGDVLTPGRRIAFPIAYGAARCDARGPAEVVLGYRREGGLHEVRLPVPRGDPTLARLHRQECDLRALAAAADVGFAPGWRRQGEQVLGRLQVRRREGARPVTVHGVEGTVLFTLRPQAPLPLRLRGEAVELPVEVTVSRCDPHALIESKRSYDFPSYTSLGDDEPLYATLRPDAAGRALMLALLLETCRPGG